MTTITHNGVYEQPTPKRHSGLDPPNARHLVAEQDCIIADILGQDV